MITEMDSMRRLKCTRMDEHNVEILNEVPDEEREDIDWLACRDTAGRRMQTDFVSSWNELDGGQTIDYLRDEEDLPDEFFDLFVIDQDSKPQGVISLSRILRSPRPTLMSEITDETQVIVPAEMPQEDVPLLFEKYDLTTAGVVNAQGQLIGMITVDDVMEVAREEFEEDVLRLGGVGEENVDDGVIQASTKRFTWLLVNLGTAILASIVIGMFDATLEQMVALAVLMPIVASMGGNAGTQTHHHGASFGDEGLTNCNTAGTFQGIDRGFAQRLCICLLGGDNHRFLVLSFGECQPSWSHHCGGDDY